MLVAVEQICAKGSLCGAFRRPFMVIHLHFDMLALSLVVQSADGLTDGCDFLI